MRATCTTKDITTAARPLDRSELDADVAGLIEGATHWMTWNPITGCAKVSQGCKHCYAEREWPRMVRLAPSYAGRAFTDVACHEDRLDQPLRWKRPRKVFVNSMSDLFHPDVPDAFIDRVFAIMALAPQHVFQVLTKRPARMQEYLTRPAVEVRIGLEAMANPRYIHPKNRSYPEEQTPWQPSKRIDGGSIPARTRLR